MPLFENIKTSLIQAQKEKNELRVSVLRQLIAAVNNEAITLKKKDAGLNDDEVIAVIKREAKKRKDSITAFTEAGRNDLSQGEQDELAELEQFLPEELPDDAIRKIVERVVSDNADGNFGQIMGAAMKEIGNKADGARVRELVQRTVK